MRLSEREFLSQVLEDVEGLPQGLGERLLKLLDEPPETLEKRADGIRELIEEHARD
jgi:hypothetical protein